MIRKCEQGPIRPKEERCQAEAVQERIGQKGKEARESWAAEANREINKMSKNAHLHPQWRAGHINRFMLAFSDGLWAVLGLYSNSGPKRIDKCCDDQSMIIERLQESHDDQVIILLMVYCTTFQVIQLSDITHSPSNYSSVIVRLCKLYYF
jgi:hypothetical protein